MKGLYLQPQKRDSFGEMAERFNAAVLKTVDGVTRPGVRIPVSPLKASCFAWSFFFISSIVNSKFY